MRKTAGTEGGRKRNGKETKEGRLRAKQHKEEEKAKKSKRRKRGQEQERKRKKNKEQNSKRRKRDKKRRTEKRRKQQGNRCEQLPRKMPPLQKRHIISVPSSSTSRKFRRTEYSIRCGECGGLWDQERAGIEDWISCDHCDQWYHILCTDLDPHLSPQEIEA